MRKSLTTQAYPHHWSKDFVEHLRTVHFALVTVSVGLILLLSSKAYDPKAAASQMARVTQQSKEWTEFLKNEFPRIRVLSTESGRSVKVNDAFYAHSEFYKKDIAFVVNRGFMPMCGDNESRLQPLGTYDATLTSANIREFRAWWERLRDDSDVTVDIVAIESVGKLKHEEPVVPGSSLRNVFVRN